MGNDWPMNRKRAYGYVFIFYIVAIIIGCIFIVHDAVLDMSDSSDNMIVCEDVSS